MNGKVDLHIHTRSSDGIATPQQVLQHIAQQTDMRLIAITDHDCIDGAVEAARLAPQFGVEVIVGEEVSTREGHLLALFIHKTLPKGRSVVDTIKAIHAQGGLAIAPHPFDQSVPSIGCNRHAPCLGELRLDGLEGFNGSVFWPLRACNLKAQTLAHQLGLAVTGGSDAHSLGALGKGYTLFDGTSASDLYRAIQRRATAFGGEYWRLAEHVRMLVGNIRNVGIMQSMAWAAANAGQMA